MANESDAYSVGELLRIRRGNDRWHLALVQRDEVWDVDRMRRLLDSLLAGYPIGALLLCRTTAASQIISRQAGQTTVSDAEHGAWQLLDGQQRINALYTTLTPGDSDHTRYGRFFLNLTAERPAPNPEAGRSDRQLDHIVWRSLVDLSDGQTVDDFLDRPHCIDLSRVYDWVESPGAISRFGQDVAEDVTSLAARIDPRFTHPLSQSEADRARRWLRSLVRLWADTKVPVMRAEVETPEDLLELFARLNRSGVPFHDSDIYFAAVKTFWPEAEPSLKRLIDAATIRLSQGAPVPLLDMTGALRLVSRVAARALGRGDVLPLRVSRIAGSNRHSMVATMSRLTEDGSDLLTRVEAFAAAFGVTSQLGYATRLVKEQLWDEVLAWAVVRGRWDDADIEAIDSYLLGASLFSYPTIFGTAFNTLSLVESLVAGAEDRSFPAQEIIAATWVKYPQLKRSSRQVSALVPSDDASGREQMRLADSNASLLLSLAQGIPMEHERHLDVDHIYPSALARRMHGLHPRSHHPERWRVNSIGNKWLLDYSLNRSLQDLAPHAKFERLVQELERASTTKAPTRGAAVWAREQWAIEKGEIDLFQTVDEMLTNDIDDAMAIFASLTSDRAARLLLDAMESFPAARRFALDHEPSLRDPAEFTSRAAAKVADRLGLPMADTAHAGPASSASSDVTPAGWTDRESEIEWVMKDATRLYVLSRNPNGRAYPTQTGRRAERHGFRYVRWVWLGTPDVGTHIGIGVPANEKRQSRSPLWLILHPKTPGYGDARERLHCTEPGSLEQDDIGTWKPLDLDVGLRWSELRDHVLDQFKETVAVLSMPAG